MYEPVVVKQRRQKPVACSDDNCVKDCGRVDCTAIDGNGGTDGQQSGGPSAGAHPYRMTRAWIRGDSATMTTIWGFCRPCVRLRCAHSTIACSGEPVRT